MPRGVWKVLLWTSLATLFRCCGALSSGRLSIALAPKPEPSLWWSLYGGEATKALGFYCRFKRNVWHRADAKGGLKSAPVDLSGHAVSLLWCCVFWAAKTLGFYCGFKRNVWHRADATGGLKSAPVGPKPEFSIADSGATFDIGRMPRGVWKVLLWTSLAMLFRCCGALSSGRLSVVPAPKPEPSLWWCLYGGEATKALGFYRGFRSKTRVFYSGFRRNVWQRAHATGGLKSAPVDLSGHAVSLLRCSVFWASFYSPGAKTWAITMVESLWWRSYQGLRFLLSIQAQRLTSGGCQGGCGGEATKALGFYCRFKRNVWHRADAKGGVKSAPVDLSGHAVSLLWCCVFWAAKTLGFYCGFKRNVWHRADATGGLKSAPVGPKPEFSIADSGATFDIGRMPRGVWKVLLWTSLAMGETRSKDGFVEPAWPCCCPVWWPSVWRSVWMVLVWHRSKSNSKLNCYSGLKRKGEDNHNHNHNQAKTSMLQGMQVNASQNSCFLCGIQARRLVLGGEQCVSKIGPLNRPGHAVSLLRDLFF